jgi:hypothetical protein
LVVQLAIAQKKDKDKEKDVSIPLDHFYVDRQGPSFFRIMLSKINFGLSTGYGSTVFKHELPGFALRQPVNGQPLLYNPATPANGYSNWFNQLRPATITSLPSDFVVNSDTTEIGYRSKSFTIPLQATLHVEFGKVRIGAGYSFDYTRVRDFEPLYFKDDLADFTPDISSFFVKKYFLLAGVSVYRYDQFLVTADVNLGGFGLGNQFDNAIIDRGMFVNLGATVEREMSEYFRLFIRPSYEIKSFDLQITEAGRSINHSMNAFYLNIGASYRIPELRKCFIKECRAQINHAHGNREYRSRVHPIHKKQNPHYGENYPNIIKYKGKNKRKLNPY